MTQDDGDLKEVTLQQAESMLKADKLKARREVENWFGKDVVNKMGEARAAVLVDMAYNLGSVRWPNLTDAVKKGDYERAGNEIMSSKYATQVGDRALRNS